MMPMAPGIKRLVALSTWRFVNMNFINGLRRCGEFLLIASQFFKDTDSRFSIGRTAVDLAVRSFAPGCSDHKIDGQNLDKKERYKQRGRNIDWKKGRKEEMLEGRKEGRKEEILEEHTYTFTYISIYISIYIYIYIYTYIIVYIYIYLYLYLYIYNRIYTYIYIYSSFTYARHDPSDDVRAKIQGNGVFVERPPCGHPVSEGGQHYKPCQNRAEGLRRGRRGS